MAEEEVLRRMVGNTSATVHADLVNSRAPPVRVGLDAFGVQILKRDRVWLTFVFDVSFLVAHAACRGSRWLQRPTRRWQRLRQRSSKQLRKPRCLLSPFRLPLARDLVAFRFRTRSMSEVIPCRPRLSLQGAPFHRISQRSIRTPSPTCKMSSTMRLQLRNSHSHLGWFVRLLYWATSVIDTRVEVPAYECIAISSRTKLLAVGSSGRSRQTCMLWDQQRAEIFFTFGYHAVTAWTRTRTRTIHLQLTKSLHFGIPWVAQSLMNRAPGWLSRPALRKMFVHFRRGRHATLCNSGLLRSQDRCEVGVFDVCFSSLIGQCECPSPSHPSCFACAVLSPIPRARMDTCRRPIP